MYLIFQAKNYYVAKTMSHLNSWESELTILKNNSSFNILEP